MKEKFNDYKYLLVLIILTVISISISLIRVFLIDTGSTIHLSDGYLQYANMLKESMTEGSFQNFYRDEWFYNYGHKNRVGFPFMVAVISKITFLPVFLTGVLLNMISSVSSMFIIYYYFKDDMKHQDLIFSLMLLVTSSTFMTNSCRFATDGVQTLFILISVYYFKKWYEDKKFNKFIIFSTLALIFAVLTRESSVLLFFIYFFTIFRSRNIRLIFLVGLLISVIVLSFIYISETSLLFIILRNVFTKPIAQELSQGKNILINAIRPFDNKLNYYNLYYLTQSAIFSILIYGVFGAFYIINTIGKENTQKVAKNNQPNLELEVKWIFWYFFFLIFVYNGRILDRFFFAILPFLCFLSIKGMILFFIWGEKYAESNPETFFTFVFNKVSNYENIILICLIFNVFVSVVRLISTILF